MNSTLIMLLISVGSLVVGAGVGLGLGYLKKSGKDPQAILSTAETVISEAKVVNDDIGKLVLPAPVESAADKIIQFAQVCVHSAEQKYNSSQITKDQRNQNAYDAAMNMLKIAGYEPTLEIQKAVKDMIETGVFDMNSSASSEEAGQTAPDQAVSQAIATKVKQVVTPIATQAANDAVQQAINQTAQAFSGAVTPQAAQPAQDTSDTQVAQSDSQAQAQQPA
ncbi:hypothetical protein DEAC_c02460 [Desulfosporosinus acididurans]|uniref:Uncharacterized protein n=1 Tax=Desulfosporosinus acididurans TaxID=476652 RepID=A0A0J1FWR1_9FIRM|nr:hypothetical protein [Desulfosporosinus acididurans]KLU67839.1 hypothetical protein DEAC_c02460 [Desulfosporosinus acididurans]